METSLPCTCNHGDKFTLYMYPWRQVYPVHVTMETNLPCTCNHGDKFTLYMYPWRQVYPVHVSTETSLPCTCIHGDKFTLYMYPRRQVYPVHVPTKQPLTFSYISVAWPFEGTHTSVLIWLSITRGQWLSDIISFLRPGIRVLLWLRPRLANWHINVMGDNSLLIPPQGGVSWWISRYHASMLQGTLKLRGPISRV